MLTQEQVTALTAQAAAAANIYPSRDDAGNLLAGWQLNDANVEVYTGDELYFRGVGVYGQTPESLVLTGYLKPASLSLIVTPDMTAQVLNTPAVWTGQFGIESLLDYLNSTVLQNISQISLLAGSYQGLLDAGYITGNEEPRYLATLIQPATKYGVTAVIAWIERALNPADDALVSITARQGQYAIDFVDTNNAELNPGVDIPGFTNTVVRDEVDFAVEEIIGNSKIPAIEYADIVDTLVQQIVTTSANIPTYTDEDGNFRLAPGSLRG